MQPDSPKKTPSQKALAGSLSVNKPDWLKTKIPTGANYNQIKQDLRSKSLYTVCEEARCPNIGECWGARTATLMILGDTCTRACRFCNVKTGNPGGWLDADEPAKTAESVAVMNLVYAVITMVDRDDLADFGVGHINKVFAATRTRNPETMIEFLGGDFAGDLAVLKQLMVHGRPEVFAHNLETVASLTPRVRDARASYKQSLKVLAAAKEQADFNVVTKSALMLGLGESMDEVKGALEDLRQSQVDIVNIGQYLRPTKRHLAIKRFVTPAEFDDLAEFGYSIGFKGVASGPLVRSSYKAHELYKKAMGNL